MTAAPARRAPGVPGGQRIRGDATTGRIVNSVARALDTLETLSQAGDSLTLAALSRRLHVPKSTLHAILCTLAHRGMIERLPDRTRYRLGPKLTELGFAARGQHRLVETARPYMEELVRETGESAFLGVFASHPSETLYIGKIESPHVIRYTAELGERRPSHATAAGKVLLAALPVADLQKLLYRKVLPQLTPRTITDPAALLRDLVRIRGRGVATTFDERIDGASGVAAPVRHAPGQVAALALIGPTDRIRARLDRCAGAVTRAARQIERAMGQRSSWGAAAGGRRP